MRQTQHQGTADEQQQAGPGAGRRRSMRGWDCFACATAELAGWLILVAAVVRTTMVLRGLLWLAVVVAFGVAVWALRRNAEGGNGEPAGPGGAPGHES